MLSKFLKDRINIAKKIIEDLSDEYEYISILNFSFVSFNMFKNTYLS